MHYPECTPLSPALTALACQLRVERVSLNLLTILTTLAAVLFPSTFKRYPRTRRRDRPRRNIVLKASRQTPPVMLRLVALRRAISTFLRKNGCTHVG